MVINKTLSRRKMATIDHQVYQRIFGFPVIDYYRRLGFDFIDESFEVVGTEFIQGYEKHKFEVKLHDGAEETLDKLAHQGVTHSILSAYKQNTLDELVDHFGLTERFIRIIGLDNHYAHSKVDNGIRWMSELGMEKEAILFVGDTEHDLEVARAIGVDCVLIPGGHQSKEILLKTGAPVLEQVVDILSVSNKLGN